MRARRFPTTLAVAVALVSAWGAEPPQDSTEELIERERIRAAVEAALDLGPAATGAERIDRTIEAVESLLPLGDAVVPYLGNELEQEHPGTFDFCAYALGRLDTPAAEATLRAAIRRAEDTPGSSALARKAWAAWALGLQGHADVVDLLNTGQHLAAHYTIHGDCSVLEAVALQTAPASVPLLIAQLERYGQTEELRRERRPTLRALRRVGDPAAAPAVVAVMRTDPNRTLRAEAAFALRTMGTPEAVRALVDALADAEPIVRNAAALSLERIRPALDPPTLLGRLELETDPMTRGALYRMIAELGGPAEREILQGQWGRPDPQDRRLLVEALGRVDDRPTLDLLRRAVSDPDNAVAIAAVRRLGALGGKGAAERLVDAVALTSWTAAQVVAQELGRLGLSRAGGPLTERLDLATHEGQRANGEALIAADRMASALVALRYTTALPRLRKMRQGLQDARLGEPLDRTIEQLELIERLGRDVGGWTAHLADPDRERRRLARQSLAALGGDEAARALAADLDAASDDERVEILRLAGQIDAPATRQLLTRVLLEPAFDPSSRLPERAMAAWSARRLGGPPMLDLLRAAADRRHGRDAAVLVYAGVLGGPQALPLLREWRLVRMHYLKHSRGVEQDYLDWLVQRIEQRRSLAEFDVPPDQLPF